MLNAAKEVQKALEEAGHWGVPTLVFEGEPFFGQDRVDMAKWRLEQKGLAARLASRILKVSTGRGLPCTALAKDGPLSCCTACSLPRI